MTTPVKARVYEIDEQLSLPKPFILRRLHSLLGFWLVLYLCQHLLVNSQAALFFHDDGYAFVSSVNKLESLPYIKVIEWVFLGIPFLIHGILGVYYAWTSKLNAHPTNGTKPALPQYKRNRAFSWQRITSWLLIFGILAHVIEMRFIAYPAHATHGDQSYFMVRLAQDKGLPLVADKLNVKLYNNQEIQERKATLLKGEEKLKENPNDTDLQNWTLNEQSWLKAAMRKPLKKGEILGVSPNAGAAFFLTVRETFKSPLMVILYTLFVIAATFHAFNGLWTFMIKWGITLTRRSQKRTRTLTNFLMLVITFLGLMAAWGTYWTFQFQG